MASFTFILAVLALFALASAQDPTCATGVKASTACCPAGCGKCGGADCGVRGRMLKLKCCIFAIKSMDANCLTSDPPCKITTTDPDFTAISDVADPTCEMGLKANGACCPKECSVCGGMGCRARGNLINSKCCTNMIMAGTRGCEDTGAPCALNRPSTGMMTMAPTPMPMEATPMPMEATPMPMEATPMPMEATPMPMEATPMPMEATPMPMEATPMPMEATPMPMEATPMPMEATPMPMEATPMPMESTPMPMEPTPMPVDPTDKPLPRVCTNRRTKFLGGCFCYLFFSEKLVIKRPRPFRMYCRELYGTRKQILSQSFSCRRFAAGPLASQRTDNLIRRLNEIIPTCTDLGLIEKRI